MTKKNWKKILIIAACVVAVLLVVAVVIWAQSLVKPLLIVLAVLALGWISVELFMRWQRKRKQKAFDEGISAKEGIEDRKREWGGWVTELDRQGLDRYELPFYLLVGEPQAGKSVLLQNSDLHFPFGQERLSGVGGTRGCDWWFTDEAVILDLAGRLFTHEGGAADKLEWEAFLEMLAEFRPMCPANGVLLVVPCDSLLSDTLDQCAEKANKIQAALLTLTQKLEANLPVYLVLTKADKIFGFAESVHRLEARMRHEMFGWSRGYERADQPLDLAEAKEGIDELVQRARILRERMLATARIPEALPEVDRLYAFPDELAGLWPALEVYLKRTFTESALVEKTTLRGMYLTSGLQTGAPIAKACADLLGEAGEADARDLDSLFANQRAYFIKDVVRRRMFEERGLVRPTAGRVSRARQRAMVGYGASAVLALAAVGYAVFSYVTGQEENEAKVFQEALAAGREVSEETQSPNQILTALDTVRQAIVFERAGHEDLFASIRPEYEELFASCFDRRLAPALVSEAITVTSARLDEFDGLTGTPGSATESRFQDFNEVLRFLNAFVQDDPPSWKDDDFVESITDLVDGNSLRATGAEFNFEAALERRRDLPGGLDLDRDEALNRTLSVLASRTVTLMDRVFDGGGPLQPENSLGFLIAWEALHEADDEIRGLGGSPDIDEALAASMQYFTAYDRVVETQRVLPTGPAGGRQLVAGPVKDELQELMNTRMALMAFVRPDLTDTQAEWSRMNDFMPFLRERIARGSPDAAHEEMTNIAIATLNPFSGRTGLLLTSQAGGALDDRSTTHNTSEDTELQGLLDEDLYKLCRAAPLPASSFADVPAGLEIGKVVVRENSEQHFDDLFVAKCRAIPELLKGADSWKEIADLLPPDEGEPCGVHRGLVTSIVDVCEVLYPIREDLPDDVFTAPDRLLRDHLDDIWGNWAQERANPNDLHAGLIRTMKRVIASPAFSSSSRAVTRAEEILWGHLSDHERVLYENWSKQDIQSHDETTTILGEVDQHLKSVDELLGEDLAVSGLDRRPVLEDLDGLLAKRLGNLAADLKEVWTTDLSPDLRLAAEGVLDRLKRDNLAPRFREVGQKYPSLEDAEYRPSQRVFDGQLELTKISYDELARFKGSAVDERMVRTGDLGSALIDLAKLCDRASVDVAKVSARLREVEAMSPEESWADHTKAGEYYLTQLQEDLRSAIIGDFREKYISAVGDALLRNESNFVAPLYEVSDERIDEIVHSTFANAAKRLLDPDGELDQARATFLMRPADGFRPSAREQEGQKQLLWQFEEFLFAWRDFLQNGDTAKPFDKVLIEIQLSLSASEMPRTIWDASTKYRRTLFYAARNKANAARIDSNGSGLNDPDRLTFLNWSLSPNSKYGFDFRWSSARDVDQFKGDDPHYEVEPAITPFLLAWRGEAVDGGHLVDLNEYNYMSGVDLPAPIMIQFPGRTPLPPRPKRPNLP